eukprot:ANDGO_03980.mRNA.1 hypothetical protein
MSDIRSVLARGNMQLVQQMPFVHADAARKSTVDVILFQVPEDFVVSQLDGFQLTSAPHDFGTLSCSQGQFVLGEVPRDMVSHLAGLFPETNQGKYSFAKGFSRCIQLRKKVNVPEVEDKHTRHDFPDPSLPKYYRYFPIGSLDTSSSTTSDPQPVITKDKKDRKKSRTGTQKDTKDSKKTEKRIRHDDSTSTEKPAKKKKSS